MNFPFIDHESFRVYTRNDLALYKNMFVPDIQPPTLAVFGIYDSPLANCNVAEMQARYAVRTLTVITAMLVLNGNLCGKYTSAIAFTDNFEALRAQTFLF